MTTTPSKQIAVNDIGSAEDFLAAVEKTLNQGCRTGDIFQGLEGEKKVNTKEMGDAIIANL